MHRAVRTVLEIIARAPAPMIAVRKARVDNLQRDRGPAARAVIVRVEAAGRELVAGAAGAAAVGLAGAVEGALEEFLVDGAVVDAGAAGPLPGVLAAVAGAALEAVVLLYQRVRIDCLVDSAKGGDAGLKTYGCGSYAVPTAGGADRRAVAYGRTLGATTARWGIAAGGISV